MAKILGDPFDTPVHTQINVRQNSLAKRQKSDDDIKVFNTSTPWIRLSSSIEVSEERAKKLADNLDIPEKDIVGSALAKKLVLFAGTTDGRGGLQRGGVGYGLDNAYGFLSDPGQGYKPMPGIISISTTYKNNGSLKQAQVNLKCYTRKQFEALEAIYLRLGYTMILEYGHSVYFDNQGSKQNMSSLAIPNMMFHQVNIDPQKEARATAAQVVGDENAKDVAYYDALREAEEKLKEQYGPSKIRKIFEKNKEETGGNYDALLAKVSNFSWSLGNDLSYDITLDLVSLGDIVDSLKMNLGGGGGIGTGGSFGATVDRGIQNLVNIRLQRNTGYFITFLQELTKLLGNKDAINRVSKESGEKQRVIDQTENLSIQQESFVKKYVQELQQIRVKIIEPYYEVRNSLSEKEVKVFERGKFITTLQLTPFDILKDLETALNTAGLSGAVNTAGNLLRVKQSATRQGTGTESYFGLEFERSETSKDEGKLVKKSTPTFRAYERLNKNLSDIENAVRERINSSPEDEGVTTSNNTAQIQAFSTYENTPLTAIKYLLGKRNVEKISDLESLRNTLTEETRKLPEYVYIVEERL